MTDEELAAFAEGRGTPEERARWAAAMTAEERAALRDLFPQSAGIKETRLARAGFILDASGLTTDEAVKRASWWTTQRVLAVLCATRLGWECWTEIRKLPVVSIKGQEGESIDLGDWFPPGALQSEIPTTLDIRNHDLRVRDRGVWKVARTADGRRIAYLENNAAVPPGATLEWQR